MNKIIEFLESLQLLRPPIKKLFFHREAYYATMKVYRIHFKWYDQAIQWIWFNVMYFKIKEAMVSGYWSSTQGLFWPQLTKLNVKNPESDEYVIMQIGIDPIDKREETKNDCGGNYI